MFVSCTMCASTSAGVRGCSMTPTAPLSSVSLTRTLAPRSGRRCAATFGTAFTWSARSASSGAATTAVLFAREHREHREHHAAIMNYPARRPVSLSARRLSSFGTAHASPSRGCHCTPIRVQGRPGAASRQRGCRPLALHVQRHLLPRNAAPESSPRQSRNCSRTAAGSPLRGGGRGRGRRSLETEVVSSSVKQYHSRFSCLCTCGTSPLEKPLSPSWIRTRGACSQSRY